VSEEKDLLPSSLVEVSEVGVLFRGTPTEEEWGNIVRTLVRIKKNLPFWLGDAILYGSLHWGETYTQWIDVADRTYDTLASYVRVCKAVPFEMRRPELAFEYHKKVALRALSLDQKAWYLDRAESGEFENSTEFGSVIKKEMGLTDPPVYDLVVCPICGERKWKLKTLHASTCDHCHAHGEELVDRLGRLTAALAEVIEENNRLRSILNGETLVPG